MVHCIPFAAYRATRKLFAPVLLGVAKALTAGRAPPEWFNVGILFLLPKKDTLLPEHTRPISVTNSYNRLIAKLLVRALIPVAKLLCNLAQKGFVPGRVGGDHIRTLNRNFYGCLHRDSNYFVLFMDTKKAFDSISHDFIHAVLEKYGMPQWVKNWMHCLLHGAKVAPFMGGTLTDVWISIKRGVKQGCPVSPIIFALVFDPLLDLTNGQKK